MDLTLTNNPGIQVMGVRIGYDEDVLTLVKAENGTLFDGFTQGKNLIFDAAVNVTDDGVLATLTFEVAEDAAIADSDVTVRVIQAVNYDEEDVTVTGVNGKVTVECAHDDGKWETVTPATCTEAGSEVRKCTICGAELESRVIAAKGHNYGEWETVTEATCTEAGSEKRVCSVCQNEETREIEALGHKFGEWTVEKEATAEEDGIESRILLCLPGKRDTDNSVHCSDRGKRGCEGRA